ncbi:sensor histidine kinase [Streptomyces spinoverrucosus]|uniref:sensor histidine kinase n=1 Tax=Streptomyces spinoverrucosus TaxID=284043 RepID=UPI0018C3EA95|nr:histidine kinase [Streptomyces spinoverrucosus]MBG0854144.1 sensor histidine kinase [Streptomyces spinoverrucosus]
MSRPGRWWRRKSTPAKVETYTRWSFHFFAVIEVGLFGLPVLGQGRLPYAVWMFLLVCGHALFAAVVGSRALDWTRGLRPQPLRLMWAHGTVSALFAGTVLVLVDRGVGGEDATTALGTLFAGLLAFGVGSITLGIRSRRRVLELVLGLSAGTALTVLALGGPVVDALASALAGLAAMGFFAFTSVFSVWLLNAVYELDEARETRARLAVAEERLRFGRDMHDVMGRNLAVIALKSELAVQLARRGRAEAVDQMIEVQRIAQESQREVRDVVRGYREADLGAELAGAQGVLTAAGIACEVSGEDAAAGLPGEVQSALGWVVREATTNVLRHGDAGLCVVGLRVAEGRVVLRVENNGASGATGTGGGSGLAGLRERLAAVEGTLEAGPVGQGVFRVVAEVPLTPVVHEVAS